MRRAMSPPIADIVPGATLLAMHIITGDNYEAATDAVRDILLMYEEMASDYEGFGHAADVYVRFDPLMFVDAEIDGKAYYIDLDLLRSGSAVAILCAFYDLWCEEQGLANHPRTKRYQAALEAGRLRRFPDIESVIRAAIERDVMILEDCWFDEAVVPIYRKYVLALFARLAAVDRTAC
jgi:hypothetical protein